MSIFQLGQPGYTFIDSNMCFLKDTLKFEVLIIKTFTLGLHFDWHMVQSDDQEKKLHPISSMIS